jgi:hypothetical protein
MYALGWPCRRENCVLPDDVLDIVSDFVKRGSEGNECREEEVEARARRFPRGMVLVSFEEKVSFSRAFRRRLRARGSMA